ncbi:hypothetical protein ACTOVN_07795 [Arcanobacterium canis]
MRKQSAFIAATMISCALFSLPGAVATARVLPMYGVASTDTDLARRVPAKTGWQTLLSQSERLMHGVTPSVIEYGRLFPGSYGVLLKGWWTSALTSFAVTSPLKVSSVTSENTAMATPTTSVPMVFGLAESSGSVRASSAPGYVPWKDIVPGTPVVSPTSGKPSVSPTVTQEPSPVPSLPLPTTTPWLALTPAETVNTESPSPAQAEPKTEQTQSVTPVVPEEPQHKKPAVSVEPDRQEAADPPQTIDATSPANTAGDSAPLVADRVLVSESNTDDKYAESTHENVDKAEETTIDLFQLSVEHGLSESAPSKSRIVPKLPIYGPSVSSDSVLESRPGQPIPPRTSTPDILRPQPAILVFDNSDSARHGLDTAATPLLVGAAALVVITGAGAGIALYRWRP